MARICAFNTWTKLHKQIKHVILLRLPHTIRKRRTIYQKQNDWKKKVWTTNIKYTYNSIWSRWWLLFRKSLHTYTYIFNCVNVDKSQLRMSIKSFIPVSNSRLFSRPPSLPELLDGFRSLWTGLSAQDPPETDLIVKIA